MYENSARVVAALRRIPDCRYQRMLAERTATIARAAYRMTARQLHTELMAARWCPYGHPDILPTRGEFEKCGGFRAEIPGRWGLVAVGNIPAKRLVYLSQRTNVDAWELRTSAIGPRVYFTTLIVGQKNGREVVIDFHPGEPMKIKTLTSVELAADQALGPAWLQRVCQTGDGQRISVTVEEAIRLGFCWAAVQ